MLKKFAVVLPLFIFNGCSAIDSINPFSSEPDANGTAKESAAQEVASNNSVPTSISQSGATAQIPGIEIIWEVPRKPVEVYHLTYGLKEDSLDREVTIPIEKLEKLDHPAFGPVFRYRLRDVTPNQDVFVSMRAENRLGISEPSKTVKISSREQAVSTAIQ